MADNLSSTCEGTSGTAISITNSGGPNQFDVVSQAGTGATSTWDNAHVHTGSTAWKASMPASVAADIYASWTTSITPTPVANAYIRLYVYLTAYPTVITRLAAFIGSAASQGALQVTTTGTIRTVSNTSQINATTAVIPLNAWCRIEFDNTGNTGTACTLAARMFSGANLETSTPDTNGSVSNGAQVTTALVSEARIGPSATVTETSAWSIWQDDIAFSDTATPGPSVRAPLVTAAGPRPPAALLRVPPQVITAPAAAGSTTASAGLAAGTGAAQAPVPAVTASAGVATGTGTAQQPDFASFTVSASATSNAEDVVLKVYVITGGIEAGGAVVTADAFGAPTFSLTPAASTSLIVESDYEGVNSGAALTPNASNTTDEHGATGPLAQPWWFGHWTGTVTSGTAITTLGGTNDNNWNATAAYEVEPSGGSTPAIDASTPAAADSHTSPVTTASFTPPAGSVLVALLLSNGSAAQVFSVSDTSGLGLTWTHRGSTASNAFEGSSAVFTTTMPSGGTTASAGLAAGTGTAQAPSVAVTAPIPAVITAPPPPPPVLWQLTAQIITGPPGTPSTAVPAGLATGAGAAQSPIPDVIPGAGLAAGAGTAQSPSAAIIPVAALAAATGTAPAPVPAVTVFAGLATGTGTALNTAFTYVQTGLATGTGTAQNPVPVVAPNTGLAGGTGTAQPPVPVIIASAGLATGAGVALNPSVSTSGSLTVNAGLATGTGAAQAPVPAVIPGAGLAPGIGTAQPPAPVIAANAGVATGTGAAQSPVPAIGASPAPATGSGSAPQVITSVTVTAGLATAAGAAAQPVAVVQVTLGPAAAAGTAQQPGITITVTAGLATGTGTALQPAAGGGTTTAPAGLATATGTAWQPVIPGFTGTVEWLVTPAAARWLITPAPPRWEAALMSFGPVAAISLEYLNMLWNSELAGTEIDPTGATAGQPQLPVLFAVPQSSGNPLEPAEPATWYTAVWLTGTNIRGYVAQGLVGPSPALVQFTAGLSYDVWGQIEGTPEIPKRFCGTVAAY